VTTGKGAVKGLRGLRGPLSTATVVVVVVVVVVVCGRSVHNSSAAKSSRSIIVRLAGS
jgi:hypothetical protein